MPSYRLCISKTTGNDLLTRPATQCHQSPHVWCHHLTSGDISHLTTLTHLTPGVGGALTRGGVEGGSLTRGVGGALTRGGGGGGGLTRGGGGGGALTRVGRGGAGCLGGVGGGLPPGPLQAVVLLGQLLYGLLQVAALLPLILQCPLPSPAVSLCEVQEVSACLDTHKARWLLRYSKHTHSHAGRPPSHPTCSISSTCQSSPNMEWSTFYPEGSPQMRTFAQLQLMGMEKKNRQR